MIKKKPAAKAVVKTVAEDVAEDTGVLNVSVSRKFTFTPASASTQYESLSISAQVTAGDYETAANHLDDILLQEAEKANVQFAEVAKSASKVASDLEDGEDDEDDTSEEDAGEEGDITEADVLKMDRKALLELAKENDLGIDKADYATTKKGLADLRADIVKLAFGSDEDGEDGDEAEDGDADEAETEDEDGEDGEIGPDEVLAMERSELIALIKENDLEVDFKSITKLGALRTAVKEAAFPEGEDEEEGEEEADGSEDEAYTEEALKEATSDDLKLIYKEWGLGKYPVGVPAVAKKAAIKAILKAQKDAE